MISLQKRVKKHGVIIALTMLVFSLFLLDTPYILAQGPTDVDVPLAPRTPFTGNYGVVADGVGLYEDISSGDIVLDVSCPVPANTPTIIDARLHWLGRDEVLSGDVNNLTPDPDVTLSVDGGPIQNITADISHFGYNAATGSTERYGHSYIEDITSLILPGNHTYTIGDFGFDGGGFPTIRLGAGIQVIYECLTLPFATINTLEGSDFFIWKVEEQGAGPQPAWKGPHSELYCFTFAAAPQPRDITLDMFIIGNNGVVPERANDLYWVTGSGTPPTADIARDPTSNFLEDVSPTSNYGGDEWDSYNNVTEGDTVTIPAGNTYLCFQMDSPTEGSVSGQPDQGISGFLVNMAFVLPLQGTPPPVDMGDNPDSYGTTVASTGPSHVISGPFLGQCVDSETDASTPLDASGDDSTVGNTTTGTCANPGDDEDGVAFTSPLVPGNDATITVNASNICTLNAWMDFDGNGIFDGGEQIFTDQPLTAGDNPLTFPIPGGATDGNTFTRFRCSTDTGLTPTGPASDGEVEDYPVSISSTPVVDMGDDPDSYGTTVANTGPSHVISGPFLGQCIDSETDASTPLDASGDDSTVGNTTVGTCATPGDDEDGVTFTSPLVPGNDATITVNASDICTLDAWIDFDGNGIFDSGEQIFTDEALAVGDNPLIFAVPGGATDGNTFTRFRCSTDTGLTPTGPASDGEVEDYPVSITSTLVVDMGDDPDSYGTTVGSNGPSHVISGPFLGQCIDSETDASTPLDASGDDSTVGNTTVGTCATPGDDEDGVTFTSPLVPGNDATITVNASNVCTLDAWVDFDGNGTFDPGEQIFTDEALATGDNLLTFAVPGGATDGNTFTRFRCSTDTGLTPTGPASDGEVEDYPVLITSNPVVDFGDNPDTYGTTTGNNGPSHVISGPFLGQCVDSETDASTPLDASGDDSTVGNSTAGTCTTPGDDEDGVTFTSPLVPGNDATVTVSASDICTLNAWMDFDGNGTFDGGEQIFTDQPLTAGDNPLTFPVPGGATDGDTFTRFRCSTDTGLTPTGPASDGEVEDYPVSITSNPIFDFGDAPDDGVAGNYPTTLTDNGARHQIDAALFLGATVDDETDGQPTAGADGDDTNADDEDGVNIDSVMFIRCEDTDLEVTSSADGFLNGWIDYNGDGDWDDAGEQIFTDQALTTGANTLTVSVPCDAIITDITDPNDVTYARFRFTESANQATTPVGVAPNGEVEDYLLDIKGLDYGDVPDSYGTTQPNDGPRHPIDNTTFLGTTVDDDPDGQPTPGADGDDTDGNDDEDGVNISSVMFMPCQETTIEVVASVDGFLNAWVDFNGNGVFDAGEQVFTDELLTPGVNTLIITVPCDAVVTNLNDPADVTYARFRFTSTANDATTPIGLAMDGEVEDYALDIKPLDFGDNPDTYDTTLGNNGPYHVITGPFLGQCVDAEPDASTPLDASGDDSSPGSFTAGVCTTPDDDEDGVTFTSPLIPGTDASITVNASDICTLNAWMDFDGNGTFDPGEQIFTDEPLAGGDNPLTFPVPGGATDGNTYARFRCSTDTGLAPTGPANDGEVEDYVVLIASEVDLGDNPDTYGTTFANNGPSHVIVAGFHLGATVDAELDGQPTVGADGDDTNNDDEDGVDFTATGGAMAEVCSIGNQLDVTLTNTANLGSAFLNAWIDFNGNGIFDPATEQIALDVDLLAGNPTTIVYNVPCDAALGDTYARFRLSTVGGLQPTDTAGTAPDGEVEDYLFNIKDTGAVPPLSLGNLVWHDMNNNALVTSTPGGTETGIPGVVLNLLDGSGNPVLDTGSGLPVQITTDPQGNYLFTDLISGTYIVEVATPNFAPSGALENYNSSPDIGSSITPDNDVDNDDNGVNLVGGSIQSNLITLISGTEPTNDGDTDPNTNLTLDFGFYKPLMSIGNQIWSDLNNDGIFNAGETGLVGVVVNLYDSTGTLIGTTTTGPNGVYIFINLPPGDYVVQVDPSNFQPGGALENYASSSGSVDPDDDADLDDNGQDITDPPVDGVFSLPITLQLLTEPDGSPRLDGDADPNTNFTVDFGFFLDPGAGTAITLSSFVASQQGQNVVVNWETAIEFDNFGFRLLRGNDDNVAAAVEIASVDGQGQGTHGGASYSFVDTTVTLGEAYHYWLVDIDYNGTETVHGPISITTLDTVNGDIHKLFLPLVFR